MATFVESPKAAVPYVHRHYGAPRFSLVSLALPLLCGALGVSLGTVIGVSAAFLTAPAGATATSTDSAQDSTAGTEPGVTPGTTTGAEENIPSGRLCSRGCRYPPTNCQRRAISGGLGWRGPLVDESDGQSEPFACGSGYAKQETGHKEAPQTSVRWCTQAIGEARCEALS